MKGLYANIHAKRKRIAAGSKERMRKKGAKGAPTAKAFRESAFLPAFVFLASMLWDGSL